jgi:hypothetical protein
MAQRKLARTDRQSRCNEEVERTRGCSGGKASSERPRKKCEPRTKDGHTQPDGAFYRNIPMAWYQKRRHEMPVQEPLVGDKRADEERSPDGCNRDLGNHTRAEMFSTATFRHRSAFPNAHLDMMQEMKSAWPEHRKTITTR